MRQKVIGAVGKNGSGKDTVLDIIAERYGLPSISMGDMVREIAKKSRIEPTRGNLNEVSRSHFERYGRDFFIKMVIDKIESSGAPFTVVTGVRTYIDARTLRDRYESDFLLLDVVVSDDGERLRRALSRASKRDPRTLDEMKKHDEREERVFGLSKAATIADRVILNDGTLDDLQEETFRWVNEALPGLANRS